MAAELRHVALYGGITVLSDSSEAESATQSFREIRHHFGICIESQNEGKENV